MTVETQPGPRRRGPYGVYVRLGVPDLAATIIDVWRAAADDRTWAR